MREEASTEDRSRRRRKADAARVKQFNTISTATGLAILASALWKPVIEHAGRIDEAALISIAVGIILLAITVVLAPLGDAP